METDFTLFKYFVFGFFSLIVWMFAVAAIFGKRIRQRWELEAEFRDAGGKEFGEFDIQMSHIERAGRVYFDKSRIVSAVPNVAVGQMCRVVIDGREAFATALAPDQDSIQSFFPIALYTRWAYNKHPITSIREQQ